MSRKGMLEVRIGNHKLQEEQIKDEVRTYVQDTSQPLDDRWEVFKSSELGEASNFIEDFDGFSFDDLAHIRDYGKYETVRLDYIVDVRLKDEEYDPERIIAIKESILKKFIKSYQVDW